MADTYRPYVAELADKRGYIHPIHAKQLAEERTVTMTGDVTGTANWDFGEPASASRASESMALSIGEKKVTTAKLDDRAVTTPKVADDAVTLAKIDDNAMNGTVQDNDSKLATHAAVKTYVDAQISGQGTYLGKKTVAEVNAMVTANLHNGDRVQMADAGTINLGPGGVGFDVVAGEDLILYKSGSTVQWDTMDGNFKTKQSAVVDPTASGSTLEFIDSITQDENGEITASKKAVQDGTTSQKGVVQLLDSHTSTATDKAATPKNVKEAYDLASTANSGLADKQDKPSSATENNIAVFNGSKSTKDSGKSFLPSTSTWDGTSNDKVPTARMVQTRLDLKADLNKVVAIGDSTISIAGTKQDVWYKVAELKDAITLVARNIIGNWNVVFNRSTYVCPVKLCFNARVETNGIQVNVCKAFTDDRSVVEDFIVKVVTRGAPGNVSAEIWISSSRTSGYYGVTVSEISTGNYLSGSSLKNAWNYNSYTDVSQGSAEPVTDAQTNVIATSAEYVVGQQAIPSPTNDNIVAMDANGLVKDSGLTKASVESAITAAGSAIQGVKVNETTLTPDANKVVTIPLATTSADGAMSAADKTTLENAIQKKTGFAYFSTSGNAVFKIAEKSFSKTSSHSEQYVFSVAYSRHTAYIATSELNIGIVVNRQNSTARVEFLINSVKSKEKFSTLDWTFKASADFENGLFTLYAERVDSNYTTVEASLLMANSERNDLYKDFSLFNNTNATLPETIITETTKWLANSTASSGTAPVKVDAYGALTPVPMDSTPTASSTNLMTSGDIKTALDGKQNTLPTTGDASSNYAINVTGWSSIVRSIEVRSPQNDKCWAKIAETTRNNQSDYSIAFNVHNDGYAIKSAYIGVLSASFAQNGSGENIRNAVYFFRSDAIEFDNIKAVAVNTGSKIELWVCNKRATQYVYFVPVNSVRFNPVYGEDRQYTQAEFESYLEGKTSFNSVEKGVNRDGSSEVGSSSVPVWVNANGTLTPCTDDFVHDGDVAQTYSSSSAAPISGAGVSAALATSLTDVDYVANASGGGGNLNKTKNGSTTSVLAFMTTAEATSLWQSAWAAAN